VPRASNQNVSNEGVNENARPLHSGNSQVNMSGRSKDNSSTSNGKMQDNSGLGSCSSPNKIGSQSQGVKTMRSDLKEILRVRHELLRTTRQDFVETERVNFGEPFDAPS